MKSCNEIKEMISLYIDGEIDTDLRNEFENHIQSCEDCRIELQGLEQIINLCGSITEEELPKDFKHQLHEKLLAANGNNVTSAIGMKETNKFRMHKYVRIAASIAAVLLIAVMLKVLFPMSGLGSKTGEFSLAEEGATSATRTQSVENKASIETHEQYGAENENNAVAYDAIETEGQSTMLSMQTTSGKAISDSVITVKVENPGLEIDKLRAKAMEYGAEFREVKTTDGASENIENGGSTELVFKMPYDQYNGFVEALKADFGDAHVVTGAANSDTGYIPVRIKILVK